MLRKRRSGPAADAKQEKNLGGRPTDYRASYCDQAYKMALLGLTDAQMADVFECSVPTFIEWKERHPRFLEAINRGKAQADAEIAHSTYHRAKGYSHKAVKIFLPKDSAKPLYAPYVEHYPPDTQAASLWLRNRQPKLWRDKVDHEHTVVETPEQIEARKEVMMALFEAVQARAAEKALSQARTIDGVVREVRRHGALNAVVPRKTNGA